MKRIFRIDLGGYGGELTIGTVSSKFVEYWKGKMPGHFDDSYLSKPLINHLKALKWGDKNFDGLDQKSPKILEQDFQPPWNKIDDIEHLWGVYADCDLKVTEVSEIGGDDINNIEDFESNAALYSREAYFESEKPKKSSISNGDDFHPVLLVHNSEKGHFGSVFVEAENGQDFDPKKFSFGQCENNYFEIIDSCFYDYKKLEINTDWISTSEKNGYFAMVGYMNLRYHDKIEKYTEQYIKTNCL